MVTLVQDGQAAPIHVPAWAEAHERFAAEELAGYIMKMTGARPEIRRGLKGVHGPAVIIADLSHPATPALLPDGLAEPLALDGHRIVARNQVLYIVSREASGVVAGIYGFLRRACGCAFLEPGEAGEYVPMRAALALASTLDVVDNPACWMRGMQFAIDQVFGPKAGNPAVDAMTARLDWMAKNGLNYALFMCEDTLLEGLLPELKKRGIRLEFGHHLLGRLNPAETYLAERPDFFPLSGAARRARMQIPICPCNPDAIRSVSRTVEHLLEAHPAIELFDLWAEEALGPPCACAACRKVAVAAEAQRTARERLCDRSFDRGGDRGGRYGERGRMRQYLHLANQVAELVGRRFPKVKLSVLACYELINPPTGMMEIHPNVHVCLALYWRSMSHAMDDPASPINRQFMAIIREWLAVLDQPAKLYLYTYEMGMMGWWSLPYPALTDLFHDWDVFRSLGVGGGTIQSTSFHFAAYGLNYLAVAALQRARPPGLAPFVRRYCRTFYGAAAEPMERLILDMERHFGRAAGVQVRPKPWLDIRRAFSKEGVARWRRLLDRALAATEEPLIRWRVERMRTLVNYVDLWLEAPCRIHLKKMAWAAPADPGETLRRYARRPVTAPEEAAYGRWLQRLHRVARESRLLNQGIFNESLAGRTIY